MPKPNSKSLILDLLSTLRRGSMPVKALVAAAEIFGIAENALRVSLARLLSAQLVERDRRGRYRLGPAAQAVDDQVMHWRRTDERFRNWDGNWVAAQRPPSSAARKAAQQRGDRALLLVGFRELQRGLFVRPDNLVGGVARSRDELTKLGLDPATVVFGMHELDAAHERKAHALWDTELLIARYRATRDELESSERQLPMLAVGDAMLESFVVGGRAIRQLVLDPLLPEPFVPNTEFAALFQRVRDYDLAGRACWSAFLHDFGVIDGDTPSDRRVGEATAALPAPGV